MSATRAVIDVAVEHVAHLQRGGGAQPAAVAQLVVELPRIEADDAHHQRGGVVARAGRQRGLHQRLAAPARRVPCSASAPSCCALSTPCTPSEVSTKQSPTRTSPCT